MIKKKLKSNRQTHDPGNVTKKASYKINKKMTKVNPGYYAKFLI